MLPSNLLITRKWRNTIRPVYAELNRENLQLAERLIQTYQEHVSRKKGDIEEEVAELEQYGYDHRYVRGLSTLLERRCILESATTLDPVKTRRTVFNLAYQKGIPTSLKARREILSQAASQLQVTANQVEESLYADLEVNFTLKEFKSVQAEPLVKQYNLSLTQTLLFKSTELIFTTKGNWQSIFRQIKWLGLIYTIRKTENGVQVKVDGPSSLFKLTKRYGTSLAKLLPTIIQNREWSLKAKILRRVGDRNLLDLELDNKKYGGIMGPLRKSVEREVYDSQVEKDFGNRFKVVGTGWEMIREPEPLPLDRQVMIPDFLFQKGGLKVYMEVVGFWTPRYLREKTKKLDQLRDIDMIVAADRDLACRRLDKATRQLEIIYYHNSVPLKPILAHLKRREEELVKKQSGNFSFKSIALREPVVEVKELAEKYGVLINAMKKVLNGRRFNGYNRVGDVFIRKDLVKEIQRRLEEQLKQKELTLSEASKIIMEAGGKSSFGILKFLGYEVKWYGISPESAKVKKQKT